MRLYLDTSVIGGYFDKEFEIASSKFFAEVRKRSYTLLLSDILEVELQNAPEHVKGFYEVIRQWSSEKLTLTEKEVRLAQMYIDEKVVGATSVVDCRHIALAVTSNADALVSWNFKHIVNLERIEGYNFINLREGYKRLEIRSPRDTFTYE